MNDSTADQKPRKKRRKRKRKSKFGLGKFLIAFLVAGIFIVFYFRADFVNARASAHLKDRDFEQAKEWLDLSERIDANNPEAMFLKARLFRLTGDTTGFETAIQAAAKSKFDPVRITREKLLMQAQAGQFDQGQARRMLVEIINSDSLHGDEEEVSEAFVIGFIRNSQFHFAKEILDVWAKDFPNNSRPLLLRGIIENEEMDYKEAESFFRKGLVVNPTSAKCAYELGGLMVKRRKPNEALEFLKLAQQHGRDEVVLRATLLAEADCYRKLGESDKARSIVTRLLESKPDDNDAILSLAKLHSDRNDYTAVIKLLRPVIKETTRNNDLRQVYALALRETGDSAEGTRQLEIIRKTSEQLSLANELKQKVAQDAQNADHRCKIGKIFLQYGSVQEGLMWLNSAHSTDPSHGPTLKALIGHYEMQNDERAVGYFTGLLQKAKFHPSSKRAPTESQANSK